MAKHIVINQQGESIDWLAMLTSTPTIMFVIGLVLLALQVYLMRRFVRIMEAKFKSHRDTITKQLNKKNK